MAEPLESVACVHVVARLWDLVDAEGSPHDLAPLRLHVAACATCRSHEAAGRRLRAALHAMRPADGCPPVLRERILGLLATEGDAGG